VSISPTFFFAQLLKYLQFEFVIFRQKDFGAKAAHKMLVKLTPGWLWEQTGDLFVSFIYFHKNAKFL
jgi:hypothetical protein